jgi:hypothetical protein
MEFKQTRIPSIFCQNIKRVNMDFLEEHVDKMAKVLFTAASEVLKVTKEKDKPTAFVINDIKGNMLVAGKVQYHANTENEDMPGNWSYEWTFNSEDIADCKIISISNNESLRIISLVAHNLVGIKFNVPTYAIDLLTEVVNSLSNWLDENAKENEEVKVELPGFFEASVVVENGVKIKSIVPDGAMKRIIKDDAALEE